jgi:PAS domain S-box-containing protein
MQLKRPLLAGVLVFACVLGVTLFITYQQYQIFERSEREKVLREASAVSDRIKTSLSNSLSATKTLAFLVQRYGALPDFDSVAREIMASNQFIDAVELTRLGLITNVYPLKDNEEAIGYDVLRDSAVNHEALKALERKQLYFAGPLDLRQGGRGVVGRLPIFRDRKFWGFSVVLIKFSTLLRAAGIDPQNPAFDYQLSKSNPTTGVEEFFLEGPATPGVTTTSVEVPDGAWKLYVSAKNGPGYLPRVLPFLAMGLLFSLMSGYSAWYFARQPERLKAMVDEVTARMMAYQKSATQSLERVNRLYHFTSRINHMVVHAKDEGEMYNEICQISVKVGGYKMAWIGLINKDDRKIYDVASYGDNQRYLANVTPIGIAPEDRGGPAVRMLMTGSYVRIEDISTDPLMATVAPAALERGYRSCILLPIRKFGEIVGSFNLYAEEPHSFDENEIKLLTEATGNVSFALDNFERDRLRSEAEALIQSEMILSESIINSLPGVFYLYNKEGKFLRWNRNLEMVTGYPTEELRHLHPLDFFTGEDRELIASKINEVFSKGYGDVVAHFTSRNGNNVPYFFNGRRVDFDGTEFLIGMGLDITDQVNAEQVLIERTEEIERLSVHLQNIREEERARIALEIHDVLGQQLTALKMDTTWLKKRIADSEPMNSRLAAMMSLIDETIRTVRRISSELRPGILDDLGLIAALEWQGNEFSRNTGMLVDFETNRQEMELERNFATNVFRVYQEALTNIARHSQATRVVTQFVANSESIQLIIRDDGKGIDPEEVRGKNSLGLVSMKERARLFRGEVTIENNLPHGTVVKLRVPVVQTKSVMQ